MKYLLKHSMYYSSIQWYPTKPGLASGIVLSAYFTGYMISMISQTYYLNPKDLSCNEHGYFTDEGLLSRIPFLFLCMTGINATLQMIGTLLISRPESTLSISASLQCQVYEWSFVFPYSIPL